VATIMMMPGGAGAEIAQADAGDPQAIDPERLLIVDGLIVDPTFFERLV